MGKGRPRAVQKGGLRQSSGTSSPSNVPPAPVYYPSEEEFKDPLEYIYKIRPEAEPYGVCKIVPPQSWKPPFALDSDKFKFPTKTQAIHQLQARPAACDSKTFVLDYNRFLEERCGRKTKKRVVFEGADLDLCRLFNAVKRYGGYDKVVKYKKWGDVARFLRSSVKVSECAKHVLCQLYREHLFDYEGYYNRLNREKTKSCKRRIQRDLRIKDGVEHLSAKRRRRNNVAGVESCRMKEKEEEENDQICEQCNSGLHGEVMLLCDRCNKGWHIYCLSPPLEKVPPGNWYCLDCLNSNEDNFGFVPGKQFSMEDFRRIADRAKKKWFGSGSVSRVHVEKKFWEIVEGSLGEVEVMYGSDLDTSLYGSGFPRGSDERPDSVESNIWDEYCSSPWNLNNLPKLRGSMLHAVHQSIAGVMVPWLYVGMLFSSFCWHFEDHCFYSMNYLHWGEPKCWYSVPGSESDAFEKVMRKTLPDLFDAQPDLLFQLVTMLNPTVLQENGVPVYSVLQEPGNFVITFPRSFHGGFNFGFNCAEAVNFAPADWIPHGGYCADLYRLYRKPAVLSHEELLCVVAKGDYDSKVTSFLKKELLRIYSEEKGCREQLWKNGIIKSSPMPPRKCPESVGTEEDPTCIICQQYLYLSAVVCCCRPSAYVCLEHWKHICECKPSRRRLLYRHTLAELNNLILTVDRCNIVETQSSKVSWQASLFSESSALARKVKGSQATLAHLAEQWLLRSSSAVENPFSKDVYRKLLKEAEQFLWAGSDMDPVRIMEKKLVEAQSWAEGVRSCLHTIESCSAGSGSLEKANLDYVNELLTVDPLPCNEPRYLKLKEYAEEANKLASEIDSALLSCSKISELEDLYSRSCHLGIHVKGSQKLQQKVCSVKEWLNGLQMCLLEKRPGSIAIDSLYNLKSEVIGLNVLLPETELLLELLRKAETYRARCTEVLKDTMNLEKVGMILQELDRFTVTFPELELLRQYHTEAVSWMSRFNTIRMNIHERVDQDKVVKELNIILREAASLRIEVRELPLVELELKKACCRAKALQAKSEKMPLDFVRQLIIEAVRLQIDGEDLFVYIRGIVDAATLWEGSAVNILAREGQLTEFEEILRASDDIPVILPSLGNVISVITMAKSWLKNSEQFLQSAHSDTCSSSSLLEVGKLKEVVSESKLLKISLEEKSTLEILLKKCTRWEEEAFSLLQSAECLYNLRVIDDGRRDDVTLEIDDLLVSLDAMIKAGLSLGFDFCGTQKLRNAHSGLQWCNKVLHFSSVSPSVQEIESLMELEEQIRVSCACGALSDMLIDAVKWMKKASVIVHVPSNYERYSFIDAEETLAECQLIPLSFPVMAEQLASKIQNHRLWQGKVHQYLSLETDHRLWSQLLQLKDMSEAATFNCPERDIVLSEVEKVENWRQCLQELIGISTGDSNSIIGAIIKIKGTLDRSLYVYDQSRGCRAQNLCMCCSNDLEFHDFLTCSICENCYHLPCLGPAFSDKSGCHMSVCSFCQFAESGSDCQISKNHLMQQGERPELNVLRKLCADVADLSVWMEERDPLQELLERALECKACLTEIIDSASAYAGEELSSVSRKLATALKAMAVAAVHDHQGSCSLEVALARHLWRVRARNLFQGFAKPTVLKIQNLLKEGLTVNVARNDYYMQKLMELKDIGLQWAKTARKVASDSGALALDKVFEVIVEGENLPVYCEKELTLLRSRSMLYCICRKPYDQRPMIACDQCDEWYHFDCIKLFSPPEFYICPACKPQKEEFSETEPLDREISTSTRVMEPKTPSPQHRSSREKQQCESRMAKKPSLLKNENEVTCSSRIDQLWWRNRKPFRRTARKRAKLDALAFFNLQQ